MPNRDYILQTNPNYFSKILDYHGISYTPHPPGDFLYIDGFPEYNFLHDINAVFSTRPSGNVMDRTKTTKSPFNFCIERPWKLPTDQRLSIDDCFLRTVRNLEASRSKINILWSGGIDSTAVVVGFLKHSTNLSQIRVLYTIMSIKENPNFFMSLAARTDIELVEIGGDVYLTQNFDGVFVNGDGADDLTASLDDSFFDEVGFAGLIQDWQSLFYRKNPDSDFIDFCQWHFEQSGTQISTVLEARWWFYTNSKIFKFPALASGLLRFDQPLAIGFFNNDDFEEFMFFNIDKIILSEDYRTYKSILKEYIFDYDHNQEYFSNKTKVNSTHIQTYQEKLIALKNRHYIMLLGNGTRIRTDNLPFLSETEYRNKYQNSLDYLFNV